jgi:hypothetical protein
MKKYCSCFFGQLPQYRWLRHRAFREFRAACGATARRAGFPSVPAAAIILLPLAFYVSQKFTG